MSQKKKKCETQFFLGYKNLYTFDEGLFFFFFLIFNDRVKLVITVNFLKGEFQKNFFSPRLFQYMIAFHQIHVIVLITNVKYFTRNPIRLYNIN